jgi:hypothetical protein
MTQPAAQSNLPPAARRQVVEANRLIAELNAKPGEIPAGVEYMQNPGDVQPGTNETGQRRWAAATPQPSNAAPGVQDPPAAPQIDPAAIVPVPEESAWEQRYRTLQGKYDAERRTDQERIRSMEHTFSEQQKTINALIQREAAPAAAPAAQSPADYLKSLGVSDKEIEDYGELLPIVAKIAANMFKPTANKLEQEVNRVKQSQLQTSSAVVQDRQAALFAVLDSRVPGWRNINEAQVFLDWLEQLDIFSGGTRRQGLEQAFKNLDAARVAGIFEAFVQEDSATKSASRPQVDRDTLIAPGVPRGGAAEAPGGAAGKRILSESEIADFYSRVRRKQVTPEEYTRFSAEIASATAEGRVKPTRTDHHLNGR